MSLTKYKQKRNFSVTPEPSEKGRKASEHNLIFVVQRHKATSLHYDFRLEMDGVLKSWAVPKGPSLNPADKRLAMMVEDHPIPYATFKGVIPEGNYGAGIVEIWDKGTYEPLEEVPAANAEKLLLTELKNGSLKIVMHGKKLKGEFALVRMKTAGPNGWLLIKHKDKYAVNDAYDSEEFTALNSPINKFLKKTTTKKAARTSRTKSSSRSKQS